MNFRILLILSVLSGFFCFSQEDLLKELDTVKASEIYQPSFKALQVVSGQSTKMPTKKEFYMIVAHRFGNVSEGFDNFFGLDNASTKLGGIYGLSDGFAVYLSRSTFLKTYELGAKYRLMKQDEEKNLPLEIAGFHMLGINSELKKSVYPKIRFSDRLTYLSQFLVSRRFSDEFSLQISPTYIHKNLVDPLIESESNFLTGVGGRYKISKRVSINAEYFVNFNAKDLYRNPVSLGVDIDTGGHVFQLLFSNSQAVTEAGYYTNAIGNWGKGDAFFGFNLYRVF